MTVFTPHQDKALAAVGEWLKAKPGRGSTPQIFRLFGFAGTGKTTLARHIAEAVDGEVKFGFKGAQHKHTVSIIALTESAQEAAPQ